MDHYTNNTCCMTLTAIYVAVWRAHDIFLPLAASLAFAAARRSSLTSVPSLALMGALVAPARNACDGTGGSFALLDPPTAARDGLTFSLGSARPEGIGRAGKGLFVVVAFDDWAQPSVSNGPEGRSGDR